jgi:D-3-phosphoglycerate dehydrogenase
MENRVFRGGDAAVASIDVSGPVTDDLLEQIGSGSEVLGVSAAQFAGTE